MEPLSLRWNGAHERTEQYSVDSFLPPFANAANRQVDEEIKALQRELRVAKSEIADNEDRGAVMADHLATVQKELRHYQTRLASRKDEIAGEEHLRRIAAREEVCYAGLTYARCDSTLVLEKTLGLCCQS